ncbi:hypothetical protein KXX54_002815 [Aspergillus fumigatus]|nr:hypothetical protein KXX54_002815 [Aspergillus fumigatus]KAH2833663.1 hypothetical protein KXV85_006260 [Aspergillus fumigatus]KAH2871360.1 hypothetical protein KXV67_001880 [Aspergillus fumigatus]
MLSSLSLEELISWSVSGSDERGFMLSVNATCKKLAQLVAAVNARRHEDYVEVACYNGPRKYVLVESAAAIHFLEELVATNQDFQGSVRVKAELARGLNWFDPVVHLKTCIETQSYDGPISTGTYTKTGVFEQAVGRLTERLPECAWLEAGHGSSAVQILRDFLGTSAEQQIVSLQLTTPNLMCLLSGLTADLCNSNYQFHSGGFQRAQKGYILLMLPPY